MVAFQDQEQISLWRACVCVCLCRFAASIYVDQFFGIGFRNYPFASLLMVEMCMLIFFSLIGVG